MPVLGKTKKDVVSEFRCSEILCAARGVFAEKGFNSATMDDIAEAAGVAKGTIYLYFPSKREVFLETFRAGTISLHDEVARNMEAAPDAPSKVRAFVRTRLDYAERNRDFFRIYYTEFNNMLLHPMHVRQEFQQLYDRHARALEVVLRDGIDAGDIRLGDPLAMARIVYDLTRGMIAQRMLGWSTMTVDEASDFLFDIIWKGLECSKQ
jgi:AcrR family transcriptional regulator